MLRADWRHLLRDAGAVLRVYHTTVWRFLHEMLKLFLLGPGWTKTIGNGQGGLCGVCSIMLEEAAQESKFLETYRSVQRV